ncbi:MAG: hypothetical protein K0S58_3235 [Nitrospira sp.]|nr:hypothetical protein [Nitrospira sp.]
MYFPGPTSSVPMEFPITNGNDMNSVIQPDISIRRKIPALQVACWMASVLLVSLWGACARLEPIADANPSDLQVAADSLKMAVREAQRTALDDAKQIIELQREELASARVERERVAQALRPPHGRLHQPASMMPYQGKMAVPGAEGAIPASTGLREKSFALPLPKDEEFMVEPSPGPTESAPMSDDLMLGPATGPEVVPVAPVRTVVIQDGDTLWRLSRRHKVSLDALRSFNGLPNNFIVTGRTLRLPEPRAHQTDSQMFIDAPVR